MHGVAHTAAQPAEAAHGHPGNLQYVLIGLVLCVLTAAEVAVFYVEALAPALFSILLVLSIAKFVLVVMYYMHLKFDSKVFTAVFVAPFTLAIFMVTMMVWLFHYAPMM